MQISDHILTGLIQSLALFALVTVAYLQATAGLARLRPAARQVAVGAIFGAAAILGMMFPLNLSPGVIIDGRVVMISLAAPFGGPIGAFVAAGVAGAYRLWLGGGGAPAGTVGIIGAAVIGVVVMALLRRRRVGFSYRHLPGFGLAVGLGAQTVPLLMIIGDAPVLPMLTGMLLPLTLATTVGTILFGSLLLRERQRRENDARYQSVLESLREVIFQTDLQGRWTFLSPAWSAITGHGVAGSLGRPWNGFVHADDLPRCPETGEPWRQEVRCRTDAGGWRWVEIHARPRRDETGAVVGMSGTLSDIDARRAAESAARVGEERLQGLLSRMPKIIFCAGERGGGADGYHAGARIYGADAPAMAGTVVDGKADVALWYASIHPEDRPRYLELERRRRELGEPYSFDYRVIHPQTGQFMWMRETAWRMADEASGRVCYDSYILDITSEKETAGHLRELARRADSANRAKSDFLAAMSHEIRTPLNAIIGFSDMLQQQMFGPIGNEQYRGYAKDIHDSGVLLMQLINDILDLSKIEAGKQELHLEAIDAGEMARACMRLVGERALAGGIALKAEIAPTLPPLSADARALKQILLNLLSNAVKFTPGGGEVRVELAGDADGFVFRVADTGIGIARKDIPRAMAAFGQVDNVFSRKYAGTGLGLPLVHALVALHGGSFTLDSEVGVGTTATVRLPHRQALQAA